MIMCIYIYIYIYIHTHLPHDALNGSRRESCMILKVRLRYLLSKKSWYLAIEAGSKDSVFTRMS